ncbi:MAG: AIPR family protein [Anaerolineae bacterium]|nr:AIPR family protein [Anaerolineae bacterium]
MDRITEGLLKEFVQNQQIQALDESTAFEYFCNYAIVSANYQEHFSLEDISVGAAPGIDGIAIIVNGNLVTSVEEIDDLIEINGYLDSVFIFIQSKTSSSFDSGDLGNFAFEVRKFFSVDPNELRNDRIREKAELKEHIFKNSTWMIKANPICKLYYATTGIWTSQDDHVSRIEATERDLSDLNYFSNVTFEALGAKEIRQYYQATKNDAKAEITFRDRLTLPDISGVDQSYIGILPASEYLKLITDEQGSIRRSLFYDNVRDYQGENRVNQEIEDTLRSQIAGRFPILNNGVTIIASSIRPTGNRFALQGYQIVNGCQTSHAIYNVLHGKSASEVSEIYIPIKLVSLTDEELITQVIKSTNSQTAIKPEQMTALKPFAKDLESFYTTFEGDNRLYYERRSGQYLGQTGIEKPRIITISTQIKAIASMFLDLPHLAWGHSGKLATQVEAKIYQSNHSPTPYFVSSLCYYRLEHLFKSREFDAQYRRFRFVMLMIVRYQLCGAELVPLDRSKKLESSCKSLLNAFSDAQLAKEEFEKAISIINGIWSPETDDKDIVKNSFFTERIKTKFKPRE